MCQDSCNKAYFPSLFCEKIDSHEIVLQGNTFNNFFKYPDPTYVLSHESKVASVIPRQPNYQSQMIMIAEETKTVN